MAKKDVNQDGLSTGKGDPEEVSGARCGGIHPDLCPSGARRCHDKYAVETSEAIKNSCEAADNMIDQGEIRDEGDDLPRPAQFLLCPFCAPSLHQTVQTMQTVGTAHCNSNIGSQLNFQQVADK